MIQLIRKEDCCGCTACESICGKNAIVLKADEEGFLYPDVNKAKCVDCHLCEKVCPIITRKNGVKELDSQHFYAVRHKDTDVLMNSSSGGAFSAFAKVVLDKGGIVYGATYDDNMVVRHVGIEKIHDLWKLRGSKYVQSDIRGVFIEIKQFLVSGRFVLFSGTPCQVEGLKLFLRKPHDKLLTIDVVCHAVTSPMLFKDYMVYLQERYRRNIVWLNMRDKLKNGWNHHFTLRVWPKDKKSQVLRPTYISWLSVFGSEMASRPSCHKCLFTNLTRSGDITLADFWDDKKTRPDVYSSEGTSLLIVNSNMGKLLLDSVKNNIMIWPISEKEAWQPCLEQPTPQSPNRDDFWRFYFENGSIATFKKYCYIPLPTRYKWKVKDFIAKLIGYVPKN